MNHIEEIEKQKYIRLSQIAPLTPYTVEYLTLLAGRGQLKAVQQDGVWYSTMEWVNEYVIWINNQMEAMNESFELPVSSYKTEEDKLVSVIASDPAPAGERSNPEAQPIEQGIATVASTLPRNDNYT